MELGRPATFADLRLVARENFDFALMARFYALRMRSPAAAVVLHAFANWAFLEAGAFQDALDKGVGA